MKTPLFVLLTAVLMAAETKTVQAAESISVPNALFEMPATDFVATNMISWETSPQQADGAIGVFYNDPAYEVYGEYIYNCVGSQAAYIFADPGVAIFQDYNSVDSSGGPPSHAFNAIYQAGKSYQLEVGLIGGDQGAAPGVILQMSLYYRDISNNMVTVAATNIVYTTNVFPNITNFVDCSLTSATVMPTDPWAGQNIGIQFLSIIPTNVSAGGDWDLNDVQLPAFLNPSWSNGQFHASLQSEPGLAFKILATTNLTVPLSNWTAVTTFTNVSGTNSFVDPATNYHARFYEAEQLAQP
jgi:hypothetical protein